MKFYKEKLSRRVRWPIGVICFSLVYGQVYGKRPLNPMPIF